MLRVNRTRSRRRPFGEADVSDLESAARIVQMAQQMDAAAASGDEGAYNALMLAMAATPLAPFVPIAKAWEAFAKKYLPAAGGGDKNVYWTPQSIPFRAERWRKVNGQWYCFAYGGFRIGDWAAAYNPAKVCPPPTVVGGQLVAATCAPAPSGAFDTDAFAHRQGANLQKALAQNGPAWFLTPIPDDYPLVMDEWAVAIAKRQGLIETPFLSIVPAGVQASSTGSGKITAVTPSPAFSPVAAALQPRFTQPVVTTVKPATVPTPSAVTPVPASASAGGRGWTGLQTWAWVAVGLAGLAVVTVGLVATRRR